MIHNLQILFSIVQKPYCTYCNLTLSSAKCQFHQTAIDYLGFQSKITIQPFSSNIIKITAFPTLKNKKHLKSFICLCGFYCRLISNYSKLMDPLIKLNLPKILFLCLDDHGKILKQILKIFYSKTFISLPDWSEPYFLSTYIVLMFIDLTFEYGMNY